MSIETTFENLEATVEDLDDTIKSNTSATNGLVDAIKELIGNKTKLTTVNVVNSADSGPLNLWTPTDDPEPQKENFCGFLEGDRVLYVSSVYKHGLPGVVKFHSTRAFRDGEVPVIREDSNAEDVYPARSTILASALEHFEKPAPDPWYKGDPDGSMKEWNERMLRAAAEDGFYVSFIYQKVDTALLTPEAKRVTISRVTSLPPAHDLGESVVTAVGYDPSSGGPRNYRLDRIKSYVRYSD